MATCEIFEDPNAATQKLLPARALDAKRLGIDELWCRL